jgi:hypothetical protein
MVLVIQALVVLAVVSVRLDPLAVLRRAWARMASPRPVPARELQP